MREAGCAVLIVHHDTKPGDRARNQRRRPQRASEEAASSRLPMFLHVEALDGDRRLLVPTAYKFHRGPTANHVSDSSERAATDGCDRG